MAIAVTLQERNALAEYMQGRLELSGDGHRHRRGGTRVDGAPGLRHGCLRNGVCGPAPVMSHTARQALARRSTGAVSSLQG